MSVTGFSPHETALGGGKRAVYRVDMSRLPRIAANSGGGAVFEASSEWVAASVDKRFYTASRPVVVKAIRATVTVAGNDGSAVTAIVQKVPSGTAIGSGTTLHSGSINLKGAANTAQTLSLSSTPADLLLAAGDSLAIDFTGDLSAATGAVTVELFAPASNDDLMAVGTNASDAGASFLARGGWQLQTAATGNDQYVLTPHTDSGRSGLNSVVWRADYRPRIEATFQAGASIADAKFGMGFKLTPTTLVIATDDDQAMFFFDADASHTAWRRVSSAGGVDTNANLASFPLVASRWYRMAVQFEAAGRPEFWIGEASRGYADMQHVGTGAAIAVSATGLVPFIGIQTLTTAAKAFAVGEIVFSIDRH